MKYTAAPLLAFLLNLVPASYFITPMYAAQYEAGALGINNYHGLNPNLSHSTHNAADLKSELLEWDSGEDWQVELSYNDYVYSEKFVENGSVEDNDPYGTDWADIVLFSGHGTRNCAANLSTIWFGTFNERDYADTNGTYAPNTGIKLGNNDANIAILAACQSMHKCVSDGGGYWNMKAGQLNVINGFHGLSYDIRQEFIDYYDDAFWDGIGDDWLDDLYGHYNTSSGVHAQCPTTMVFAYNKSKADTMFEWGGLEDLKTTGTAADPYDHPYAWYYYLNGCNPDEGEEL